MRASSAFVEHDWYALPHYYDMVFDTDTKLEADFLEQMRHLYGRSRGHRVLEPACGTGRLLKELARRGYRVSGFDRSPEMLTYARQRLAAAHLPARLVQADLAAFSLAAHFDLAHCLVSTFKYLRTEEEARAHLRQVREALTPGGLYVLGFHLTDYDTSAKIRERWVARRGATRVICNIQTWPPRRKERLEQVRTRLVIEEQRQTRCFETHWDFRTYDAAEVRRLLRAVPGLELAAVYDFTYRLDRKRELTDDQLDTVLVLRKESLSSPR
ncbi:MAG: class I SAM-dependent methyltransferase [Planctomycetota bacterium]